MPQLPWQGRLGVLRLAMIIAVLMLLGTGLYFIGSTAPGALKKQMLWIIIGSFTFLAMQQVHYRKLGQICWLLYGITIILLVSLLVGRILHADNGFIRGINGSYRWLSIPWPMQISLQPSEIAKLIFILVLAWTLARQKTLSLRDLIIPILITILPMALILISPDLGTTLLFIPIFFSMLIMAGIKKRYPLIVLFAGALLIFPVYTQLEAYQQERIHSLLNQDYNTGNNSDITFSPFQTRLRHLLNVPYPNKRWFQKEGFQLDRSRAHIATGKTNGYHGDHETFKKMFNLPEAHNDFIFALIVHRWGFWGGFIVISLFGFIILGALEIASNQPDRFGQLVAVGIATLFLSQMFINIGVTMGLAPNTGMTLPFVSYGGTSLLFSFIALGLLVSVARNRPYK